MAELIKVLSIDGGGIRAIIPAMVLDYIEKHSGRYTADMFDLLTGTSSGGIVALGLVFPGTQGRERYRATELADLFF
ncbi:MAG: patatin-like phospholipase family protein, partial [Chloroflexota bacterium]